MPAQYSALTRPTPVAACVEVAKELASRNGVSRCSSCVGKWRLKCLAASLEEAWVIVTRHFACVYEFAQKASPQDSCERSPASSKLRAGTAANDTPHAPLVQGSRRIGLG